MAGSNETQRHIVVINDSADILNLFDDLLGEEGYRVTTDAFTVGIGALHRHIKEIDPDLVILDLIIGREDFGWQLVQLLKMDPTSKHIPLIICTGMARQVEELSGQLSNLGVGVVIKPFELTALLDQIADVMTRGVAPSRALLAEADEAVESSDQSADAADADR